MLPLCHYKKVYGGTKPEQTDILAPCPVTNVPNFLVIIGAASLWQMSVCLRCKSTGGLGLASLGTHSPGFRALILQRKAPSAWPQPGARVCWASWLHTGTQQPWVMSLCPSIGSAVPGYIPAELVPPRTRRPFVAWENLTVCSAVFSGGKQKSSVVRDDKMAP